MYSVVAVKILAKHAGTSRTNILIFPRLTTTHDGSSSSSSSSIGLVVERAVEVYRCTMASHADSQPSALKPTTS